MFEWIIGFVLSNPGALRVLGGALVWVSGALAVLGWRVDRLFGRIERRAHIELTIDQMLPAWLAWAVPETAGGWILVAALFVLGLVIGQTGKKIERALR